MPSILIIEDEGLIRFSFSRALKKEGLLVSYADNGVDAKKKMVNEKYDVAVVDLHLGDSDCRDVIRNLKKCSPKIKVIVLAATFPEEVKESLLLDGTDCFYEKPFDTYDLVKCIEEHLASLDKGKISEERHSDRNSYRTPINFALYVLDASTVKMLTFSGEGIDISHGGISIRTDYPLERGHLLEFTEGESKSGVVAWSRKVDDHSYRAGIKFIADTTQENQLS